MILVVRNILTNSEKTYNVASIKGFQPLFDDYPRAVNIALKSKSLEDAAHKIAEYIDSGSRVAAYIRDSVQKNEKEHQAPQDKRLILPSSEEFQGKLSNWAKKRKEINRGLPPDTTYVPDPGRQIDKEPSEPITDMEKLAAKIRESK